MDEALGYLATAMFNVLDDSMENSQLYCVKEEELENWLEITKWIFGVGHSSSDISGSAVVPYRPVRRSWTPSSHNTSHKS